jgi:ribokinase
MTLGEKGSIFYQREAPHEHLSGITKGLIIRTPAIRVSPIDTTGAGDAFNGGLAAGLVRFNGDLTRAIKFATVVAGLSTEKLGTAPAMPRLPDVQAHSSFYK